MPPFMILQTRGYNDLFFTLRFPYGAIFHFKVFIIVYVNFYIIKKQTH
jgi:hypothetical protein